jgi:hypothetical protein
MASFILLEASPWLVADGSVASVRLAGGGSKPYTGLRGFTDWRAGVSALPLFVAAAGYSEQGWTGGAIPATSQINIFPADDALRNSLLTAYHWKGAPIALRSGDDSLASPTYILELTGVVDAVTESQGTIALTVADLGRKLDVPVCKAKFAGTGGIEGPAEAEGRTKRRSWGYVRNVEGRLLDKANNIFEFGDPAFPLNAFTAVKDMGRDSVPAPTVLAWQGSIAATLAALQTSSPASGSCVVAPSIACVKWWTVPAGPLTADIQGEVGSGYVNKVADIAARIVSAVDGTTSVTSADVTTINGVRAAVAGIHIGDNSETIANALDRLLAPVNVLWGLNPDGTVRLGEVQMTTAAEVLTVIETERVETFKPVYQVKLGYMRNHRQHTDAEISAAILTSDISDAGDLASADFVTLGTNVRQSNGTTIVTDVAAITSLGTAAAILGQAATATNSDFAAVTGATKPSNNADVTANVAAIGDANRVRFSRFEGVTKGWSNRVNTSGNALTTGTGLNNGRAYIRTTGTFAGAGQSVSICSNFAVADYRIPVVPSERLYVGALPRIDTLPAGSTWALTVSYLDSTGAPINASTQTLGSGSGVLVPETFKDAFVNANAAAYFAFVELTITSGASGSFDFSLYNPMLCSAGASQTARPAFNPGPFSELAATLGADINSNVIDGGAGFVTVPRNELKTSLGIAAGFAGQAALATRGFAYFGSAFLTEDSGGATQATLLNFKTPLGTAAGFAGQGALAVKNTAGLDSDVTDGTTYVRARATGMSGGLPAVQVAGSGVKIGDARNLPAIAGANLGYKFNGTISYTSSTTSATISVGAGSIFMGGVTISLSAMSIILSGSSGQTTTYQLYINDPTYAGGAQTLLATATANLTYQNDGYIWLGAIQVTYQASGTGNGFVASGGGPAGNQYLP